VTTVRVARGTDAEACVEVLAQLPEYFTPDTHAALRRDFHDRRAWVAVEDGTVVGFVLVEGRFPTAAEITFAAVRPERRGSGIGTRLVTRALAELRADGVALVEVKTLDASARYEPYRATRRFWERRGFRQVDRIDPLPGWQPGNPSAIYVAALRATVED
jgi:ribosomal protein S18 acetylase RimI-like enzyme